MRLVCDFLVLDWYLPAERAMYWLHGALVGKSYDWKDNRSGPVTMRVTFEGNLQMKRSIDGELGPWMVTGPQKVAVYGGSHVLIFSDDCCTFVCNEGSSSRGQTGTLVLNLSSGDANP